MRNDEPIRGRVGVVMPMKVLPTSKFTFYKFFTTLITRFSPQVIYKIQVLYLCIKFWYYMMTIWEWSKAFLTSPDIGMAMRLEDHKQQYSRSYGMSAFEQSASSPYPEAILSFHQHPSVSASASVPKPKPPASSTFWVHTSYQRESTPASRTYPERCLSLNHKQREVSPEAAHRDY